MCTGRDQAGWQIPGGVVAVQSCFTKLCDLSVIRARMALLGAVTPLSSNMPLGLPSLCEESKRFKPLRPGSQLRWQVPW